MRGRASDSISHNYYLSLGAGHQQIPLIQAARRQGFTVIACDRQLNAPGLTQADIQIQCSILKPRDIIRLLHENVLDGEVMGVGCRSHGEALRSAMMIAKYFSVPHTEPRKLKIFQNKCQLKKLLVKHGVPMIESALPTQESANSRECWEKLAQSVCSATQANHANGNAPLVVRPVDSFAKQGVEILQSYSEVMDFYLANETKISSYLVEPYVAGSEITVLGTVSNGICEVLCITDKEVLQAQPWFVEICHSYPSSISNFLCRQVPHWMQKICTATGLANGPIVAEFLIPDTILAGMSPLYLVECQPEVGGEYLADELLPKVKRIDYFERLVEISSKPILGLRKTAKNYQKSWRHSEERPEDRPQSQSQSQSKETVSLGSVHQEGRGNLASQLEGSMLEEEWEAQPRRRFMIRYIHQTQDGVLRDLVYPKKKLNSENPYYAFHKNIKPMLSSVSLQRRNLDRVFVFGMSSPIKESAFLREHVEGIANEIQIVYSDDDDDHDDHHHHHHQ